MEASISEFSNSHFRYPPSVNAHDTQEGDLDVVVKVHTDWSRATREGLKLLKCASEPYQSKIPTYFEVSGVKRSIWDTFLRDSFMYMINVCMSGVWAFYCSFFIMQVVEKLVEEIPELLQGAEVKIFVQCLNSWL